ncbi:type VII secretion integral membrane protein EccD [Hamadaea tsunoensis]|uniref:type VII secretion integral membrane protein EccD n=1 Tax=Hamadaea tsunoensis TaxID=53368 RepID=UPI00040ED777|nr:type VII secretion integral membrane protein EccD [Hamadaea tsunoensis]
MTLEQTGLARIIVIAPHRRVEMTVPEHVPLAGILPSLLRHAGPTLAEDGIAHGGWVLRRVDGVPLDPARSLAMLGVLDGETLVLAPHDRHWPEPAFDDVAEAIADGAARLGAAWSGRASLRTGRAVAALALTAGLVLTLTAAPGALTGGLAVAAAALLLGAAVVVDRAGRDAEGARLLGTFAMLGAAAGAALLGARGGHALLEPWPLAGALAALLATALLGEVLMPAPVFAAGATLATGLGAGAVLAATTGVPVAAAGALVAALGTAVLFALPRWAMSLGGLTAPGVPTLTGEAEDPAPPATDLAAAVRRSDTLLTGLLWGTAGAVAVGEALAPNRSGAGGLLLTAAVALVCALRSRAFAAVRHRVPLIAAGCVGLLSLLVYATRGAPRTPAFACAVVAAALLVALVALGTGRRLAGRPAAPQLGRLADVVCLLAATSVPILAALVLGLFGAMYGLGG